MAGELKIDVRRKKILEILRRDGLVRVSQLSDALGATVVTIRSDLDALEQDGYLERTQGGAIQTMKNYYNLEFQRRKQEHMEQKKAIAAAAAGLVHDGDTLFINSGTTTYFTAVELKKRKNINVVTNSISVAIELGGLPILPAHILANVKDWRSWQPANEKNAIRPEMSNLVGSGPFIFAGYKPGEYVRFLRNDAFRTRTRP